MGLLKKKATVVLDTNILLLFQEHVDLFSEIEQLMLVPCQILIPEQVIAELQQLATNSSKSGRAAKLALAIINTFTEKKIVSQILFSSKKEIPLKIVPVSGEKHADDAIVKIAEDAACTLDKELQGRLLNRGIRVIIVKQKQLAFM